MKKIDLILTLGCGRSNASIRGLFINLLYDMISDFNHIILHNNLKFCKLRDVK